MDQEHLIGAATYGSQKSWETMVDSWIVGHQLPIEYGYTAAAYGHGH